MPTANPSDLFDKAPPRLRDPLLQPFRLKGLSLRNRIMSTSHAATIDEGGLPKERYQRYHEEKAKGGIALTMFGGSSMVAREFELGRRPDRHVERCHHPRPFSLLVAHPRPWRRDHVPDLASRPARHLGRDELAADRGADRDPRETPSRHPARDGPHRHRPHHRRLCCRCACAARRAGSTAARP